MSNGKSTKGKTMGLPRQVRTTYDRDLSFSPSQYEMLILALTAGVCLRHSIGKAMRNLKSDALTKSLLHSLLRGRLRQVHVKQHSSRATDELTHQAAKLYRGLAFEGGTCEAEFREVRVPRYFLARLTALNAERQARDEIARKLQERIEVQRGKVYASRSFPPLLRAVIMDRDHHCCQNCLRGKPVLRQLGLHLEVDHIVAVIDGGLTTYENGITLCSECNSAKHHGKDYFGVKLQLIQK